MSPSERFKFVDTDKTFHNINVKTLNDGLTSYQNVLLWALHSEVWYCVWMGNSSKSTLVHQRDLELLASHDLPSFQHPYLLICQVSSIFLFFLQITYPLHHWEECSEAHCNLNVHCSTQFRASFLYTKLLSLWVCTFLEGETSIPELSHQ